MYATIKEKCYASYTGLRFGRKTRNHMSNIFSWAKHPHIKSPVLQNSTRSIRHVERKPRNTIVEGGIETNARRNREAAHTRGAQKRVH